MPRKAGSPIIADGGIRIPGGAGAGKVAISNANGDIEWASLSDPVANVAGFRTLGSGALQGAPGELSKVRRELLVQAMRIPAAQAAGTYQFNPNASAVAAGANSFIATMVYLDDAKFSAAGLTPKLAVAATCMTNATAHLLTTFVAGLYPVTATAGATGGVTYTKSAVVTGSTVTFTTPGASSMTNGESGQLSFPADGYYLLGLSLDVITAALSMVDIVAHLYLEYT